MALVPLGIEAVAKGVPKFNRQLGAMNKAIGKTGKGLKRMGGLIASAGVAIAKFGVMAGAAAVAGIAAVGVISIKTAISVESAFTGVAKTTDGLIDKFGEMTDAGKEVFQAFRDLAKEVPIAVEELLAIGELAGQLGVPRDALVDFTRVVAELAETTVLSTEEAATSLARLAAIYEVSSEDLTDSTRNIGSALVELGNNLETNERDILAFAERIAGAGKIAGLTQQDLLAIGAAFASVGIEAESGGTAVQKVLIAMTEAVALGGEELEKFAVASGLTAKEFSDAFEKDAAAAFEQFVFELGDAGDDAIGILAELGLQDQRLVRAFLSLAGAGGKLEDAFKISNAAFAEGNALAEEANLRFQTTESQLKIFKNTLRDVGITIGSALLPFLNKLLKIAKPFIEEFGKKFPDFINTFLLPTLKKIAVWFSDTGPSILKRFVQFIQPIIDGVSNLFSAFQESAPAAQEAIASFLDWFSTNMTPTIQAVVDNIGGILDALAELWRIHGDTVILIVEKFMQVISVVFGSELNLLIATIRALLLGLSGDWQGAWDIMKQALFTFFDSALSLVNVSRDEFLATWEGIRQNVQIIAGELVSRVLEIFNRLSTGLVDGVNNMRSAIVMELDELVASWTGIWTNIKTIVVTIWDSMKRAIENKINGIIKSVSRKLEELKRTLRKILGLRSPSKVFKGFGEDMMAGLAEGVLGAFRLPEAAVTLAATKVIQPMAQVSAPPVSGASMTRNSTVNMEFNNSLQDRMDVELLANRVEQRLVRALG